MVVILALALLAASNPQANVDWTHLPLHSEADELGEMNLFYGRAHEIHYTVNRPYPYDGVYDFYIDHFGDDWVRCTWRGRNWHSYGDGTTTPMTYVHQKTQFWIHPGKSRLIALALSTDGKPAGLGRFPTTRPCRLWLLST